MLPRAVLLPHFKMLLQRATQELYVLLGYIKLLVTSKLLPRAVLLHIRLLVTSKLLPRAVLLPSGQQPYSLAAHPQPSKLGPLN